VPIGAVIVAPDGTELARAANMREELGDPTAHAEILAMPAALPRCTFIHHPRATRRVTMSEH
jgi:tRNA(adenine34) deaminase